MTSDTRINELEEQVKFLQTTVQTLADSGDKLRERTQKWKVFAAKVVEDWLSGQPGNAEFEERFYYAMGVKAPEWLNTWGDEYVQKHQRTFKRWLEEKKEELGLNE